MITISYVNFWENSNEPQDRWFTKFIEVNIDKDVIEVEPYNNPDIIICSCFGYIENVKRYNSKIKLFFYGENLDRIANYNNIDLLKSTFDLIVGFKYTDKKNKIFRLPLWLCYYPFYNMNSENNIITYLENTYKNNLKDKSFFCSLISNHDMNGQRAIIYNEMSKYGLILCPSKFKNNCESIAISNFAKIEFIKKTKYSICPENSYFEGYFTEKIFQAFEGGNIPIYHAIDEPEKDILNSNKYCYIKDVNNNEELEIKIKDVIENPDKYTDGNIFNVYSFKIISQYYDDLIEEIKKLLHKDM
jgi:hypothetical protein